MPEPTPRPFWKAFSMVSEMGFLIAIPLVIFGVAGRWIDRQYDTSPWFLLGGLALSILASALLLVRKFTSILNDINRQSK